MIALISFKDELIMTRENADQLQLQYSECQKVGFKDNKLQRMSSDSYYKDELTEKENRYYKDDKEISYWYLYNRPEKVLDWVLVNEKNHLVDLEWFALNCKYPFYIEKCVKSEEPTIQNIQSLLNQIEEKTKQIDKTIDIMQQQTFNQKVNVHVSGGLITTYNDLCLKEDSCTDALQAELNNGWRIIAVCVQPDQRRPDYILGRYNPELDVYDKRDGADR
jgi:hypothetical protein